MDDQNNSQKPLLIPLKLTLEDAATDGIAYFQDHSGNQYFRPADGKPIRKLVDGQDNHPMMTQFCRRNPLAEPGRMFDSVTHADNYVRAISDFDGLMHMVEYATDKTLSGELRAELSKFVSEEQSRIKRDNLSLLDTVPGFDKVRKYLDMTPEQIYQDLKGKGAPKYPAI